MYLVLSLFVFSAVLVPQFGFPAKKTAARPVCFHPFTSEVTQ